ncbi:MAG: recombinase family protein, partial [Planctomycetaceae bacterium]|nr:recombinase family protein [Planctomycetaceae bacterium]
MPLLGKIPSRRRTGSDSIDNEDESYNNPSESVETFQKAAFYGRFSSSKQSEDSIDIQLDICRRRAESDGFMIPEELRFSDEGVSGALPSRAGLDRLKQAVQGGRIQRLYVRSLSRLSRDMVFTVVDFRWLTSRGVVIISIDDGIDSRQPNCEITAFITGWKNEQYLKDLAAFVVCGQANRLKQGYAIGDHCYGYRSVVIDDENCFLPRGQKPRKTYQIHEEEAEIVRKIFKWYGEKEKSIPWIATELNRLKAPLGHRRRSGRWRDDLVRKILLNPKYIGIWFWGQKQNYRDPETKKIRQKRRSEEEIADLRREFPQLRIIVDAVWDQVHQRFHQQHEKWKFYRESNGRLSGSPAGTEHRRSQHMLVGTVFCQHCGARLYVGGSHGQYQYCPNYRNGTCRNRTMLLIDLAERLLLSEIQQRILDTPDWIKLVYERAISLWQERQNEHPHSVDQLENQMAKLKQKIDVLLNRLEDAQGSFSLLDRLKQRETERKRLEREIAIARRKSQEVMPPPTLERIHKYLLDLWGLLQPRGSEAVLPLRNLVGGKILAEQIDRGGKKRDFIRLHVRLDIAACSSASEPSTLTVPYGESPREADDHYEQGVTFSIDCRVPPESERLADEVVRLWNQGMLLKDIAESIGKDRNFTKKAFSIWHEKRGLPVPDVRSHPNRHRDPNLSERLVDQVMLLYKANLPMQEIAKQVGHDKNIITAAVRIGCEREGIPYINGRTRRLKIRLGTMEYLPTV